MERVRAFDKVINRRMNPSSPGATALVVEDNAQVRRFEVLALRDAGFDVLEATSGPDALESLRIAGGRVQVLLADVILPKMSGVDLACAACEAHPGIRVLFISGYSAEILGALNSVARSSRFPRKAFLSAEARGVRIATDQPRSGTRAQQLSTAGIVLRLASRAGWLPYCLYTVPSFMTKRTRRRAAMSFVGSPSTATRSASRPRSTLPIGI